jgi:alpha-L-fucosidase 2
MTINKNFLTLTVSAASLFCAIHTKANENVVSANLDNFNVVWDSPSTDCNGTMPIGNGDLAANVWVEPNGDLLFYLSKSDAWSSGQELLKLGRVRVRLDQPLVREGGRFKQTLDLKTGTIRIESMVDGRLTEVRFWIDANHPVVNLEIDGANAFNAQVTLEPWRLPGAALVGGAVPDTVLPPENHTIRWYQRNAGSIFDDTLKNQNLGHLVGKFPDPLKDLTFGGLISGASLVNKDATTLVTKEPVSRLHLRVHALTAKTATPEEWLQQLQTQRAAVEGIAIAQTRFYDQHYQRDAQGNLHISPSMSLETWHTSRQPCSG